MFRVYQSFCRVTEKADREPRFTSKTSASKIFTGLKAQHTSESSVSNILFENFHGGVDVTERFSTTRIDPLRPSSLIIGTTAAEAKAQQWTVLFMLSLALGVTLWLVLR